MIVFWHDESQRVGERPPGSSSQPALLLVAYKPIFWRRVAVSLYYQLFSLWAQHRWPWTRSAGVGSSRILRVGEKIRKATESSPESLFNFVNSGWLRGFYTCCCNLSSGVGLNVWFTTKGIVAVPFWKKWTITHLGQFRKSTGP